MTPDAFISLLRKHDWHFEQFPDRYYAGLQMQKRLLFMCQEQPEFFRLYNHADNCIIRGVPFNFPSIAGNSVKGETQQHTTMQDQIKALLQEAITIIEALERLLGGKAAAPVATETPAPAAEKPAPKSRTPKPTPTPAPEPEADAPVEEKPAAPVITEARLRATVKTLSPEAKKELGPKMQKKFGAQSLSELAPEHYATVHAQILKMGAVDTDPDAPKTEEDWG